MQCSQDAKVLIATFLLLISKSLFWKLKYNLILCKNTKNNNSTILTEIKNAFEAISSLWVGYFQPLFVCIDIIIENRI